MYIWPLQSDYWFNRSWNIHKKTALPYLSHNINEYTEFCKQNYINYHDKQLRENNFYETV